MGDIVVNILITYFQWNVILYFLVIGPQVFAANPNDLFVNYACNGDELNTYKLMAKNEIDVNWRHTETGETALTCAAKIESIKGLKLLIEIGGLDVNAANTKGETALVIRLAPSGQINHWEETFIEAFKDQIILSKNLHNNTPLPSWDIRFEYKMIFIDHIIREGYLANSDSLGYSIPDYMFNRVVKFDRENESFPKELQNFVRFLEIPDYFKAIIKSPNINLLYILNWDKSTSYKKKTEEGLIKAYNDFLTYIIKNKTRLQPVIDPNAINIGGHILYNPFIRKYPGLATRLMNNFNFTRQSLTRDRKKHFSYYWGHDYNI
ncbi:MAG: hypothetical protein KDC67_09190 [Ignavibacteriae bacterium]|nr:hypothetical protein [Ignavibacteriota bacterium]